MVLTEFISVLRKSPNKGGWTYATWPDSAEFFGTHGPVKVRASIDGHEFTSSFMAMGGGVHMLPIKSEVRTATGMQAGDMVTVRLHERL